jgi:hypothetical protein
VDVGKLMDGAGGRSTLCLARSGCGRRSGGVGWIGSIVIDPAANAVDDAQRRPSAPAAAEHIRGNEQECERSVTG